MRFLQHQALLVWLLVLTAVAAVLLVGLQATQPALLPGNAVATRDAASDVQALVSHLPSMHVALELGQGNTWAANLASQVREAADRHQALGAASQWEAVVAAAEALAAADSDESRASYLALSAQVNQRVFSLAAAL